MNVLTAILDKWDRKSFCFCFNSSARNLPLSIFLMSFFLLFHVPFRQISSFPEQEKLLDDEISIYANLLLCFIYI